MIFAIFRAPSFQSVKPILPVELSSECHHCVSRAHSLVPFHIPCASQLCSTELLQLHHQEISHFGWQGLLNMAPDFQNDAQ